MGATKILDVDKQTGPSVPEIFDIKVGFTVMVKFLELPSQVIPPFVKCGVTMIVAVIGDVPELFAVKDGILPDPLTARPIEGVLLIQVKVEVPPVFAVVNVIAAVAPPLHII